MPIWFLFSYAKGFYLTAKGNLCEGSKEPSFSPHCLGIVRCARHWQAILVAMSITGHDQVEAIQREHLDSDQREAVKLFLGKNDVVSLAHIED